MIKFHVSRFLLFGIVLALIGQIYFSCSQGDDRTTVTTLSDGEKRLVVVSFSISKNGTGVGDLKTDKDGVVGNDESISTYLPTIKVDIPSDVTNMKFVVKFSYTGCRIKMASDTNPSSPTIELVSGETEIDFSNTVIRRLRIYATDNTYQDYAVFVGIGNTTTYSDEEITRRVAVLDGDSVTILALVDSINDNAYLSGTKNFRETQLNDTKDYATNEDAIKAGAVEMSKANGMYIGKYLRTYQIVKPMDSSKYKIDMLVVKTTTPTGNVSDILVKGVPPYQNSKISYYGEKAYISINFLLADVGYIVPPTIYVRGRPMDMLWNAHAKAELFEACDDPEYNGSYSIMKSKTFTAVDLKDLNDYSDVGEDELASGSWDWMVAEGVVPDQWLYFAFHFGRAGNNVDFSYSMHHTSATGRKWAYADAGELKPNWNNTFVAGKKYTWYVKDYLKGSYAKIMIIEE